MSRNGKIGVLVCLGALLLAWWPASPSWAQSVRPATQSASPIPAPEAGKKSVDAPTAEFLKSKAGKVWKKHPEWPRAICALVAAKKIAIGMTAEQVRAAWGQPYVINRSVSSSRVSEQWVYGGHFIYYYIPATYLYFEDGVLFRERARWYGARGKKTKPTESTVAAMQEIAVEQAAEDALNATQKAD